MPPHLAGRELTRRRPTFSFAPTGISREQLVKEGEALPSADKTGEVGARVGGHGAGMAWCRRASGTGRSALSHTHTSSALQLPDAPWGIISIKAQAENYELPMTVSGSRPLCGWGTSPPPHRPLLPTHTPPHSPPCAQPITMMRNSQGREEGGSGVPVDRAAYAASVAYWDAHAAIQ